MAERYTSFEPGGRRWLWQRLTAAFLVVVLAFHFFLLHFLNHADEVTFALSQGRMENLTYFSLMILFLVTATFHGVNGVYNALVNQGLSGTRKTAVKAILGFASVVLIVQGVRTALAWAGGVPI
ncbi:succinate dehydrogenase [Haloferax mediterranei ATCC 33500]|uniref:Succinate dehydrogenase n=1 Tax=Haloferax mediterranei (strain ATCC 33500 / DSM 1411 / JCM 8866 / NBRC 14739 / NCIMB 2177 / R-4) TaxID=523841 RepID=I3R8D7_HALMT|nr:succinate dehydrogenase hydrophobic membrane anchor subunit [Haloferax mediterranei]AFK20497.1 succinate dehydrogenase, subunit D (membrane anchor protein) [Haloferax mediterranei ATCC 33500]AHZ23856.1 succinate dehydrogenase [Haloferax mediterranei ATCC 33500]ELZ98280.1 succinate dehydrogenase subunit D [Haloferax mediterranei ATCC 33500]MDX5986747.1 succinate dehydrogenase hydrophobic membrane anchor subunit [Haloferax mediterranei ATCC 33500]QCQ76071.1 succinate dehydrogenase [Haloferax 